MQLTQIQQLIICKEDSNYGNQNMKYNKKNYLGI